MAKRLAALLLIVSTLLVASMASAGDKLTIATLAPRSSLWGKVFRAWAKAVKKKTNGQLRLRFYWNGGQGGETTVVAKMRSGQLDGATLGAGGLGKIHKAVLALQLPGLFTTWRSIDRARDSVFKEFWTAFDKKGFFLSSIGDVGRVRTFSKGRAIRKPADLRGMKPAGPRRGLIAPAFAAALGITLVPTSVVELLSALSTGRVNVISAPSLAAEQLQWTPHFDHVGADVSGIAIGAMVFSKKRLQAQPKDVLEVMRKTGKKAGKLLRARIRKLDDQAFARQKKKMTLVTLSSSERQNWAAIFKRTRKKLAQGTFSPALVRRLEALAVP